jgi:hypothetical protein
MKRRALILDRDGVINVDTGYLYRIEDCVFIEGIFEMCRHLTRSLAGTEPRCCHCSAARALDLNLPDPSEQ